jgi:hypothetical protein
MREFRRRILTAFEHAEMAEDNEKRAALLTFLIVGGGPTGVELAGAIAELARYGMDKEFRTFDPAQTRVILVQAAVQCGACGKMRDLISFPSRISSETPSHRQAECTSLWQKNRDNKYAQ